MRLLLEQASFGSFEFQFESVNYAFHLIDNLVSLVLRNNQGVHVLKIALVLVILHPQLHNLSILLLNKSILIFHVSLHLIDGSLNT